MMGYNNMAEWISDNPLGAKVIMALEDDGEILVTKPNVEGLETLRAGGIPVEDGVLIIETGDDIWLAYPDEDGEPQVFIT